MALQPSDALQDQVSSCSVPPSSKLQPFCWGSMEGGTCCFFFSVFSSVFFPPSLSLKEGSILVFPKRERQQLDNEGASPVGPVTSTSQFFRLPYKNPVGK